jgi:hypothetical protein
MVSSATETGALPETEVASRPPRRPFHKDPLSLIGWGIALASVLAYLLFFVRTPVPKPGQRIARLTGVEGRVKVKPNAREAWGDARLADRLHVGDVVQTETRSGAQISFDAGSVVAVRPDSVVYIGGSAESSTASWRVQSGRVNFSVGSQATEIVTPSVKTTATQNATGHIDVSQAGDTGVKIFSGSAQLETKQGERITLNENQAVQVDAAGKAGAKLDLPPPPNLLTPTSKAQLPFVAPPGATAKLGWTVVRNGVSYRVAMDYNVTQANILLAAALDAPGITGTAHELSGLDVGRYFWRVAAVNKDGVEGAFSRVAYFAVVRPVEPQPGASPTPEPPALALLLQAVEPVAPGIVHVGGRTEPGATVTVDGATVKVLPDGSFSEYVRRSGEGAVVVRATLPDGQSVEQSRPVGRR